MLNHSKEYTGALLASWAEFGLEAFLLPELKRQPAVVAAGVALALIGHSFRVGAMWTAGSNFNHEIMQRVRRRSEDKRGCFVLARGPTTALILFAVFEIKVLAVIFCLGLLRQLRGGRRGGYLDVVRDVGRPTRVLILFAVFERFWLYFSA